MQKPLTFDKIQHLFVIRILNDLGIERSHLNLIKVLYDKPRANSILSGEKLSTFSIKLGTKQRCPLSPLLFNMLQFLISISQEGKMCLNCE